LQLSVNLPLPETDYSCPQKIIQNVSIALANIPEIVDIVYVLIEVEIIESFSKKLIKI